MIEDMQLHSFAELTQDSYLRSVRQLAAYFNMPPDQSTVNVSNRCFKEAIKQMQFGERK
jgi:hypothetical protein